MLEAYRTGLQLKSSVPTNLVRMKVSFRLTKIWVWPLLTFTFLCSFINV